MAVPAVIANRAGWLLARADTRAHRLLVDALSPHGWRGYHVRVLAALDEGGPASQAELCRRTDIDGSDLVSTLDGLVEAGLVTRSPDPEDGRRNVVALTGAGAEELARLVEVLDAVQAAVLAPLSDWEAATLLRILRKIS